jgi:hypothetical protein
MKSKQSGITLIGFLIHHGHRGLFRLHGDEAVAVVFRVHGRAKAMNQIATEGTNGKTLDEIRRELFKKMNFPVRGRCHDQADGHHHPSAMPQGLQLASRIRQDIPFMYNIDFLLHFDKSVPLQGNVGSKTQWN